MVVTVVSVGHFFKCESCMETIFLTPIQTALF
jgi:hypothetical protein